MPASIYGDVVLRIKVEPQISPRCRITCFLKSDLNVKLSLRNAALTFLWRPGLLLPLIGGGQAGALRMSPDKRQGTSLVKEYFKGWTLNNQGLRHCLEYLHPTWI